MAWLSNESESIKWEVMRMEAGVTGSVTDLGNLLRKEGFYQTLQEMPPTVVEPFLHDAVRAEWSSSLQGRVARFQERADAVIPKEFRDEWVVYMMNRMIPLIMGLLFIGRGTEDQVFGLIGQSILQDAQRRYGRAVLVGSHVADYLTLPLILAAYGISVVIPVDKKLEPVVTEANRRYLLWPERIKLVPVHGSVAQEIDLALNTGAWLLWFTDYWYDPAVLDTTAARWPVEWARRREWPIIPVRSYRTAGGAYMGQVEGALWTPSLKHTTLDAMDRMVQDWIRSDIHERAMLWWGWTVKDRLPTLSGS